MIYFKRDEAMSGEMWEEDPINVKRLRELKKKVLAKYMAQEFSKATDQAIKVTADILL